MNTSKQVQARQGAEQTHTPTPWRYVKTNGSPTSGQHMIAGSKPGYLAEIRDCGSGDVSANAAFIVRACNAHDALTADNERLKGVCDDLVAALKVFVDRAEWCLKSGNEVQQAACVVFADRIADAYAALAKAGA